MPPASAAWQVMYCGIAPGAAETPVARVRHRRVGRIRPRRLAWDVQGQSAMRCLITGGAGFIGSHLVEYLVGAGHHVANPLGPYAASKLAGEGYCLAFHAAYELETVVLRYFNVFGPRQDPKSQYAAVVPRFIAAAL